MPTFIDESGDTGPVKEGGKPYFRLAAVWVPTTDIATKFREAVHQLRKTLGLRADFEFKFSSTHAHPDRRRFFFELAKAQKFRFTVCSIDKSNDYWNSAPGSELHWACATSLAVHLRSTYHEAEECRPGPLRELIAVDDNSDRVFLETVKYAFRGLASRNKPGASMVGKVSFRKSIADEMLQLADMTCGAVGACLSGEDAAWFQMISGHDLGVCRLP